MAYAPNTLKNLKVQQSLYLNFCKYFGLEPLPATVQTLGVYLEFLAVKFRDPGAIQNYLGGIKVLHIWNGYDTQQFEHLSLQLMLRGLARIKRHIPRQALPVTPDILKQMFLCVDVHNPVDMTFWTLFLFGFFLMCRKSNLVPDKAATFDASKQLVRRDIVSAEGGLLVTIKWSKTLQFGGRVHTVPVLEVPGSVLCPVWAYTRMRKLVPGSGEEPLFKFNRPSGGHSPVIYSQLQRVLRLWLARAGHNPALFSSHSLRRGGASFASEAGVSLELVKLIGDWKSDAVLKYIQFSLRSKVAAARVVRDKISSL